MNNSSLIKLHANLRKQAYEQLGSRIVDAVSEKLALNVKQETNARPRNAT